MTGETPYPLRMLFWEATARCNLACAHCRRLPDGTPGGPELETAEVKAVLRSAAALGKPVVVFSGGEPLLRADWPDLATFARSIGLPVALATNGTLVDARAAARIVAAGFRRVAVSLDGADADTHDSLRRQDGAFRRAVAGIRHLRAAGQAVQVNATIAAHNLRQLDDLHRLAESLTAEALHLFLLVPVGCGLGLKDTHQLGPQQCEDVLHWVCDRQGQGGLEIRATCAPYYGRVALQRGLTVRATRGCLAGLTVAFLRHDGEVFPCGYLPVRCGSVREQPLETIWRSSDVLAALRGADRLRGKCGECPYQTVCGGCRAQAFAATGDYLAADPTCSYQPTRPDE